MSRLPHELDRRDTVGEARAIMERSGCHHLPVMDGPRLYGVVSARDVPHEAISSSTPLDAACQRNVFTVRPTDSVVTATEGMLKRKIGSAIVVDAGVVVGIYTSSDAMMALVGVFK